MTLDSLPDLDTSGLCLVKTLPTALTCWAYRSTALRDGARTSTLVPISARISPGALSPGARCDRAMRWADVYVCMLADGVALRNRCPQGQADPRAAIAGGASGVTMARAGPHPRRARHSSVTTSSGSASPSMRWADVSPASMSPASMRRCPRRLEALVHLLLRRWADVS